MEREGDGVVEELVRGELSADETYEQALEKVGGERGAERLREIERDHKAAAQVLREYARGSELRSSGVWGAWTRAVEGGAKLLGNAAAVKALKTGEEMGARTYEKALRKPRLDPELKALIRTELLPKTREHIQALEQFLSQQGSK